MVADVGAMRQEVSGHRPGGHDRHHRPVARSPSSSPGSGSATRTVQMTVADGTSTTLEPRLVSGQLDLAVVTMPVSGDELSASPLFEEDLVLVVPADHPLAPGRAIGDGTAGGRGTATEPGLNSPLP